MIATLMILLASQFPSASDTAWMEPAAFRLLIGEPREHLVSSFERKGWTLESTDDADVLLHPYDESKSVVMEFRDDRLVSIRFELVSFHPRLSKDWSEVTTRLRERFGEPEVDHQRLLVQHTGAFTIHAVLSDSPDSDLGQSGAGLIIVRYFVPVSTTESLDASR